MWTVKVKPARRVHRLNDAGPQERRDPSRTSRSRELPGAAETRVLPTVMAVDLDSATKGEGFPGVTLNSAAHYWIDTWSDDVAIVAYSQAREGAPVELP